jgi:O-antigen/teichoic acid export membrane protein
MIISYLGLILGYLNKGVLFIIILSTEEIGLINLLVSLGMLFAQLSNLGTVNSFLRFFPFFRDQKKDHFGFPQLTVLIALVGLLVTSLLCLVFYQDVSQFYAERSALFVAYYFWIIPIGIGHLLFLLLETYLRGVFKNVFAVFAKEVLLRILVTISLLLYWYDALSFNSFVIFNSLVYAIPLALLFVYTIKFGELNKWNAKIEIPRRFRKIIVSYSLFNYANTLGAVFVLTMDAMMIAAFLGLSATGVYTTILYLVSALQVPYRSLTRVAAPLVPVYWREKKMKEMSVLYKDIASISLLISLFMFLVVWINRVEIFELLPESFTDGVWVFLFIMLGRTFDMYFGINSFILTNSKRYKVDVLFTLILLGAIFGLNYWLIPLYGISGAAVATMIGIVSYNLMRTFFIWYTFGLHPFRIKNLYGLVFCGTTLMVGHYLPSFSDQWILSVLQNLALVVLLYLLPIYLLRADEKLNEYIIKGRKYARSLLPF